MLALLLLLLLATGCWGCPWLAAMPACTLPPRRAAAKVRRKRWMLASSTNTAMDSHTQMRE